MPDSMYDRLGDMLHDVLESGTIPPRAAAATDTQSAEKTADRAKIDNNTFADEKSTQSAETLTRQKTGEFGQSRQRTRQSARNIPQKKKRQTSVFSVIPAEVREALAFFGLNETAGRDDAKKAYHEKLKYYHPDRHGGNAVLQKVAREKTRRVIAAWETLEQFFS